MWLNKNKKEVYREIEKQVDRIKSDQNNLYSNYKSYARQYLERQAVSGFYPGDWSHRNADLDGSLTYNVVRANVDTIAAKISMNRPKVRVLPNDALEGVQQKSRKLEKFIDGVMYAEKFYKKSRRACRDAALHGIGFVKVAPGRNKVEITHVHPSHIIVDDQDAINGEPTTMYHVEYYPKSTLEAIYGKNFSDIINKSDAGSSRATISLADRNLVRVIEAWHKPIGDQDGRRVICMSAGVLVDEPFSGEFPFCVMRWTNDEAGYHGVGLGDILSGIQGEINYNLEVIRDSAALLGVPYILVHSGTKIMDEELLTNDRARKIEFSGNVPPRIDTPAFAHPQLFQHIENLYNKSFELSGLSRLSATSLKPAGIESGIGLMTLQDVETQRFAEFARQWEEIAVAAAGLIVQAAKSLGGDLKTKGTSRAFVSTIKWADVDMVADAFDLQVYPQSSLPQNPAGRSEFVIRLAEQGLIDKDDLFALLTLQDVSKTTKLATAEYDDLERTFETMIETGEYLEPLEIQDLALGLRLALRYLSRARIDGTSTDKQDLLIRWIADAQSIIQPPPQPIQPAQQPPPPSINTTTTPPPVPGTGI